MELEGDEHQTVVDRKGETVGIESTPGSPAEKPGTLNPKIAGLLAYLFGWLGGLIVFLLEKENKEVRFHALQSIAFNISLIVLYVPLTLIAVGVGEVLFGLNKTLGLIVGIPLNLISWAIPVGGLVFWILLMVNAYNEQHFKLPVIGDKVEKWVS